jgi:hypothetical protein
MQRPWETESLWSGLGMSSIVLGFNALLLFFMPVLGIPIAVCGLAAGVAGLILALCCRHGSLRWSVGGLAMSLMALGVNIAIYYAPEGYRPPPNEPPRWQPVPARPYVPPPA